jgi:hypothetical protein
MVAEKYNLLLAIQIWKQQFKILPKGETAISWAK